VKVKTGLAVLLIFCFVSTVAVAVQNQGSKELKIDGGNKGDINFPHHLHQDTIGDCTVCHSIFPKSKGAIKDLIAQKELKKKQVMNKTCLKCHRANKKAGKDHGPTSCSACHVKK
jgi:hypothetical protein